jgi:hypothetical protein
MQKQHKKWVKVKYSAKRRTAPSAERLHLEHVHSGRLSHQNKAVMVESKLPALQADYEELASKAFLVRNHFKNLGEKRHAVGRGVW